MTPYLNLIRSLNNYLHTDHRELINLSKVVLDKYDEDLYKFLIEWHSDNTHIKTYTSGSTGTPKVIKLSKKAMLQSALATNTYFQLNEKCVFLICLPVKHIAGKMMIIRTLTAGAKVILTRPISNPIRKLEKSVSFCAMTPHQVLNCLKNNRNQLNLIDNLIIGGSPVNKSLAKELISLKTNCFVTFGMSETISHIAIKRIDDHKENQTFECLPHVKISTDNKGQLIIDAPLLEVKDLTTNDIISIVDENHFNWIGRSDNVIKSGGIKLHPELIEKKLEPALNNSVFFVDHIPHEELGAQPILIIDHTVTDSVIRSSFDLLEKYEIPKIVYRINKFHYSGNNKINRTKTKRLTLKKGKQNILFQ